MESATRKPKVLHLITLSAVGGAQDNTFTTARLHDRARYEVHVACNPDGPWNERARASADFFHEIPALVTPIQPRNDITAFFQLLKLLRRERFDIVHTHTAKAGLLGRVAAWLTRVPIVVHTYHAFPFHDFMPRWRRRLFIALERLARPFTDSFITLSESDRRAGREHGILSWADSRTIYTGIDYQKIDAAADRDVTRNALGIPQDQPVIAMVGRLDRQKAPELLVDAFAQVARSVPDALLVIVGDGELRPTIEAKISTLGLENRVRILGFRDDVPSIVRAADVFAFSSLWEAMGRAMVEAMLVGTPPVAPAIYGIPEVVKHGETGLLYDVGNVPQLAESLIQLLRTPAERARLGRNAQQLTRRLFDVREMVDRIEELYARLLPAPRQARRVVALDSTTQLEAA